MSDSTLTRGMVLGKFMPPHAGHVYLIDFARKYVDTLTLVVETQPGQPIPGDLRFRWLREMFPDVRVVHLNESNPQDPEEHPEFWRVWRDSLLRVLPHRPDFVFASEHYGWKLADALGAQFVPVDVDRRTMPISGTEIREAPLVHWRYLPRCTRPYFVKRVCVFGPESTGKSTLARDLAEHFGTAVVPEYARTHLEARGGEVSADDIPLIARGQTAAEDALAHDANRVLFCDTDLVLTTIWSEVLFGDCPAWIRNEAEHRSYDLYLVCDVDVPWVADKVRYLPEERRSFLERCVVELKTRGRSYVMIHGDWEHRFQLAVEAVNELLQSR